MPATHDERLKRVRQLQLQRQHLTRRLLDIDAAVDRILDESSPDPSTSWFGCLEHIGVHLTEADLEGQRREMWRNFPRGFAS